MTGLFQHVELAPAHMWAPTWVHCGLRAIVQGAGPRSGGDTRRTIGGVRGTRTGRRERLWARAAWPLGHLLAVDRPASSVLQLTSGLSGRGPFFSS